MEIEPKVTNPVGDEKVTDDTAETELITEDQIKTFRQELNKLLSDVYLGKTEFHLAISTFRDWQKILVDEVEKMDDAVITGLFELQADLIRATRQH